ncbi:2Fe-2S iron-sulfur cluster-binding protein, partial [Myxococcota bacterium]|nr:2Fe-2S iron-sulfur cluster-binding protein [Myxococcota bacterium]
MSGHFSFDGAAVPFEDGETLIAAATRAGHHVPHLCWHPALGPSGACRLCTVRVDGRLAAACTTRAAASGWPWSVRTVISSSATARPCAPPSGSAA